MEEFENERKYRKTSEINGDSSASASSGGQAASTGEVPRSRGGVPIGGDSATEATKRKNGDSEPGEGEDPKNKKSKTGKEEDRGATRGTEDWGEYAKRIRMGAEERAE